MTILGGLLAVFLLTALGWGALGLIPGEGQRTTPPGDVRGVPGPPLPCQAALGFLCGASILGIAGQFFIWVGGRLGPPFWIFLALSGFLASSAALGASWARRRNGFLPTLALRSSSPAAAPRNPLLWLLIALCCLAWIRYLWQCLSMPVIGWDPLSSWLIKTKILLTDGTIRAPALLDPARVRTEGAYPFFLNIVQAGYCFALGGYSERGIQLFTWCLCFASWLVALGGLARRRSPVEALSALTLMLLIPALVDTNDTGLVSEYRDGPLSFLVVAAVCHWLAGRGQSRPTPRDHAALVLLLVLIWGAKREGVFWVTALALLAGWREIGDRFPRSFSAIGRAAKPVGLYWGLPMLFMLPWYALMRELPAEHIESFERSFFGQAWSSTARNMLISASHMPIELFFRITRWGILWWVFALLTLWRRSAWLDCERQAVWLVVWWWFFAWACYVFTPWKDAAPHMAVSLDRVLLQAAPLAVVLCVLNLTRPCPEKANRASDS